MIPRGHPRRPPKRRCIGCGGDCYGWSESTRCDRCIRARRPLGVLELEPGGVAEAARAARLERFAAAERELRS